MRCMFAAQKATVPPLFVWPGVEGSPQRMDGRGAADPLFIAPVSYAGLGFAYRYSQAALTPRPVVVDCRLPVVHRCREGAVPSTRGVAVTW